MTPLPKLRAKITKVGGFVLKGNNVCEIDDGWQFDCMGMVPVFDLQPVRGLVFCGYTIPELQEIARSPDEWVDAPSATPK